MSIATLKKKSFSKYRNSSVGSTQFSLNGTHRSQGYIGQTSLSRSLPRTLAGGAYNKGHGGCCDKYTDLERPINNGVISTEDTTVVKSSVLSSKERMARRVRCCEPTVKPDNSTSLNTQNSYLEYLKHKCAKINSVPLEESSVSTSQKDCPAKKSVVCSYVKSEAELHEAISQGDYLSRMKGKCLDTAPEFQRKNNDCSTGRGACGGDY